MTTLRPPCSSNTSKSSAAISRQSALGAAATISFGVLGLGAGAWAASRGIRARAVSRRIKDLRSLPHTALFVIPAKAGNPLFSPEQPLKRDPRFRGGDELGN